MPGARLLAPAWAHFGPDFRHTPTARSNSP